VQLRDKAEALGRDNVNREAREAVIQLQSVLALAKTREFAPSDSETNYVSETYTNSERKDDPKKKKDPERFKDFESCTPSASSTIGLSVSLSTCLPVCLSICGSLNRRDTPPLPTIF